jgi:TusA-related sulfurtransferase
MEKQNHNSMERGMNEKSTKPARMNFQSILQQDVPKGRDGKHKSIVTQLLNDLEQLQDGSALKIPLTALPDSKENIRSALNRATRQRGMEVATSSDTEFLYVWKTRES